MDRLYDIFQDILNSNEKRKLKMLRYLMETNEPVTYESICEETGSSLKTAKKDICYLNDTLEDYGCIQKDENDNLIIQIFHDDFQEPILAFYRSRKCIQIINLILEKEYTNVKLSQELHIAPSSCYIYLQQIRNFLQKYKLNLTRQMLTITGDEVNLRKLMFLLQFMKNEKSSDSFVDDFLKNVEFFGIKFSPALKSELKIIIDIVVKRVRIKKNIKVSDEIKKKIHEEYVYDGLYKPIFDFFLNNGLALPEDEVAYIIIYLMNNGTLLIGENKEASINNIRKKDPVAYRAIRELIAEFSKRLSISTKNQDLFLYLLNFLKSRYISMRVLPYHYFFENVKGKNESSLTLYSSQEKIDMVKEVFYRWGKRYGLQHIEPMDIETCLILIEGAQLLEKESNKYNILLHISQGQEWEFYVQEALNQAFGDSIHILSFHSSGMELNDLQKKEIDVIVSDANFHFPIDAETIIIKEPYHLSAIKKLKKIL